MAASPASWRLLPSSSSVQRIHLLSLGWCFTFRCLVMIMVTHFGNFIVVWEFTEVEGIVIILVLA
jgi:hypothetical protein